MSTGGTQLGSEVLLTFGLNGKETPPALRHRDHMAELAEEKLPPQDLPSCPLWHEPQSGDLSLWWWSTSPRAPMAEGTQAQADEVTGN